MNAAQIHWKNNSSACQELYELSYVMEQGLRAPLEDITDELLNYSPASNKMTIGQLAVHCTAWAQYFLASDSAKPWEVAEWTCKPMQYPLTLHAVLNEITAGFNAIRSTLQASDDATLEVREGNKKGYGYIIYRLLIHAMTHANQMAYVRQIKDSEWSFGSFFGDMATAIIQTSYTTTRDLSIPGF